jgi:hypothetical protein
MMIISRASRITITIARMRERLIMPGRTRPARTITVRSTELLDITIDRM